MGSIFEKKKISEEEMDLYDLSEDEREFVRSGEFEPDQFEYDSDELEEDDFYNEEDEL